jgi:hypothetical protein
MCKQADRFHTGIGLVSLQHMSNALTNYLSLQMFSGLSLVDICLVVLQKMQAIWVHLKMGGNTCSGLILSFLRPLETYVFKSRE